MTLRCIFAKFKGSEMSMTLLKKIILFLHRKFCVPALGMLFLAMLASYTFC